MGNKYQNEIDEFRDSFKSYKDKKIVLYGIGRYTATLVDGIDDYDFVGLMDKDPANIGKDMFGLPIVSLKQAEEMADLIVINTAETYWKVIYERIKDGTLPVFYKNGERATITDDKTKENPFALYRKQDLIDAISAVEVVSFDFFDTLFSRCVCNPRDIFELLALEIADEWKEESTYQEVRSKAREQVKDNYNLDELYNQIAVIIKKASYEDVQAIKLKEIALEKKSLIPRKELLQIIKDYCKDKILFITTDMYLPEDFYQDVLSEYGITDYQLLLSSKEKKSKADGSLYDILIDRVSGKKILHIGDNKTADIQNAVQKGITVYHIPSVWDMAYASELSEIMPRINTLYSSVVFGMIIARLYNNPFVFENNSATVINTPEKMGYVVFGPVITTFLLWLKENRENDRLVFMARDGYFLSEDYELIEQGVSEYIYISRQLAMIASIDIDNEEEIYEFASMPYSGTNAEMMEDRFGGLTINAEDESLPIEELIAKYSDEIKTYTTEVKSNYQKYLDSLKLDEDCSVVDIGYYGNNQRYLKRMIDTDIKGYYINADLSKGNPNVSQTMAACFQADDDSRGDNSQIRKKQIYIESFLTAPYGMIKAVDENGNPVCAPAKKNQMCFEDKIRINEGVKQFIRNYIHVIEEKKLRIDREMVDKYYGVAVSGLEYSDVVRKSFYNDNAMMNRLESMLFY